MQNVSLFRNFEFCLLFFCPVQEDGSLSRLSRCLFYVSNAEQWNKCVRFFSFSIWFLTFKNQELVFVTAFLTLCPHSSHSSLYYSRFVLAPTLVLAILIFSVVEKLNDFCFFLDFRHFFGLQLISFKIRQYWEFARKPFRNFALYTTFWFFFRPWNCF